MFFQFDWDIIVMVNGMQKKVLALIAAFIIPTLAGAQEAKPVIRFSPFYTNGIGIEETRFIESLIQSYLTDVGDVVNYFDNSLPSNISSNGRAFPDAWLKAPDYVVSGSIYLDKDSRIFTLEIHNTNTGDTSRSTTIHKTSSDLVLKARSLVDSIIDRPVQLARGTARGETDQEKTEIPERITENNILGIWRGESGIEMIRLQQGGRGIAFFSSGAQMNLSYFIENNILKIKQNSPNLELYYYPLPFGVAKQLSAEAEPMAWELLLYSGGSFLKGVKISTEAKVDGNSLVELLPGSSSDTLWVRSGR